MIKYPTRVTDTTATSRDNTCTIFNLDIIGAAITVN